MASIFTYEPDVPRVASPWDYTARSSVPDEGSLLKPSLQSDICSERNGTYGDTTATRLQAEPQDGPVEYKLHLLLRPRRIFRATSTGSHISGSKHSKMLGVASARTISESALEPSVTTGAATPPAASTHQTRQHRLEQLTTQLLWRLQQSSPHHTSSATNIILPSLPEALPELQAPRHPAKLLHGLEESQGALYEIGVSDDGSLVGLAEDELHESLNNLRAMAACLGCNVEVLRRETVGDCEWIEDVTVGRIERRVRRTGKLFVAEALVKPCLHAQSPALAVKQPSHAGGDTRNTKSENESLSAVTEQLRVTLTGPTMSGKSSLLGTLTTSTLDNGRGKSRLSMLKHRHEISSGVTSSVTQELLGYQDANDGDVEVLNYATENVASWIDMHVAASDNRLVFVSDSAGHPRYRRTTVRGLVGWAPHWTLLCIPADDTVDTAGQSGSNNPSRHAVGPSVPDIDLSSAQLDLCLRLGLPLVVVITKLDLASRSGLRGTLSKILDALKAAGRKPAILPNTPGSVSEEELQIIDSAAIELAYNTAVPLLNDPTQTVPMILTSAVQGTGINILHAMLHELPLPTTMSNELKAETEVFHIEDVYTKPADKEGVIVSGRLRFGQINVGDHLMLGPYSSLDGVEDSEDSDERPVRRPSSGLPTSRSFPGALRDTHYTLPHFQIPGQEWKQVRVTSIRNLRLPVHTLHADQIGTIAIVPDGPKDGRLSIAVLARIRKGMVLAPIQPLATRTFVARFVREDLESLAVGNHVVVYTASVRASARVVSARAPDSPDTLCDVKERGTNGHDPFDFDSIARNLDEEQEAVAGTVTAANLLLTFRFDSSKEFVVIGDSVLVMPGGGPSLYGGHARGQKGVAGLDGFVGQITETMI